MSQTASQPIIIIGMHRSGTSLLARILRESGVHIGADCDAQHSESELMRSLNESVLDSVGASWYQPLAAETLIDQEVQEVVVNRMQSLCRSEGYRFTGNRQIALFGQSQTWGWKDPRTVLTLPIWLSVFPGARVIEIVRNGVDVAGSLVERERKRIRRNRTQWIAAQRAQGISRRMWQTLRRAVGQRRRQPAWKRQCPDLETAFSIWVSYMEIGTHAIKTSGLKHHLRVRFEDLLEDPRANLLRIREFTGETSCRADIEQLTRSLHRDRRLAFVRSSRLQRFYQEVSDHPQMIKHGYADLIETAGR